MKPSLIIPAAALAALVLVPGGCITEGAPAAKPQKRPDAVTASAPPAKVAVSPLTRIAFDPRGNPSIFLHLDFRDAADKSVKAFGLVHIELYRPTGDTTKPQALAQSWDADLRDSVRNALTFDEMITRTYTITLAGVPEWLWHWSRSEGPDAALEAPTLVVTFKPGETSDQVIRATYTLTR